MGTNWSYFWKERTDLIVLFIMLLFVFGLWGFGVKTDKVSEEFIDKQADDAYSEIYKVVSENQGVMKAAAGLFFASNEVASDDLRKFFSVLFDGQNWGGVQLIEIWKDGKRLDFVSFNSEANDLIYFEQKFESSNSGLLIKTAISREYFVSTVKKNVSSDVNMEIMLDGKKIMETKKEGFRKPLNRVKALEFGGVKIGIDLKTEDRPGETWVVFLGLGTVLSFVVYALVFSMTTSGRSAELMARDIVGDLMKYKKAINSLDSHLVITDIDGKVVFANPAVYSLTGYNKEDVIGNNPSLWGRQMSREFYKNMWETIKTKREVFKGEVTNRRKNGSLYTAYAVISPIIDESGELIGFVGSETDITDRKQLEDEQKRMNELMVGRELAMIELKKKITKIETNHV